jgi:hypothetical protein
MVLINYKENNSNIKEEEFETIVYILSDTPLKLKIK